MRIPLLLGGLVLWLGLKPVVQADPPRIVAHRGASFDAPENTLAAFQLAWEQGADAIEGDFFLTRDGQIVCVHDANTQRTARVDKKVAEATLAELRQLDVGQWKGAKWTGEKIPTLQEVLATVPPGKQIFIEVKCGPEIVPPLRLALSRAPLKREQVVIIAFDPAVIAAVKKAMPRTTAYWLTGFRRNQTTNTIEPTIDTILEQLHKIGADGLDCSAHPAMNATFVRTLRAAKMAFHVWTINRPDDARRFAALGVDSITTDRPAEIRQALAATDSPKR